MKYLKCSFILLIGSLIVNTLVTSADAQYPTTPISGTVSVNYFTWPSTPERTKTNWERQKIKIVSATCDGCTFSAQAELEGGGATGTVVGIGIGSIVELDEDASIPENWHALISRSEFFLINQTVGYTYDPNALVL